MTKVPLTNLIFEDNGCPYQNKYQGSDQRLLFVCSAGLLRSPTAAVVAARRGFNTRSCGSAGYALINLSANLLEWADKIIFVNNLNLFEAKQTFGIDEYYIELLKKKSVVWTIEDDFEYMNPTLVKIINEHLDRQFPGTVLNANPSGQ